ncbi:MAG: PfkB family carbohydrate kinase [Candidatus Hodarchaeales archaeon]
MKEQIRVVILGQIVLDTVVSSENPFHSNNIQISLGNGRTIGGPPFFAGRIGKILSTMYSWIAPPLVYAYACTDIISLLKKTNFDTKNLKNTQNCPQFQLIYTSDDQERILFLKNPPSLFIPSDFNWSLQFKPVAVVGSTFHEFNDQRIFKFLRKHCSFIAFDPQGCFRQFTSKNRLIYNNWWNPSIVREIDCIKVSLNESRYLNLGLQPQHIALKILETSIKYVLITQGRKGVILGVKNQNGGEKHIYQVPSYIIKTIINETGAGDVFLFLFVIYLIAHGNELDAVAFATSATSLFLEKGLSCPNFTKDIISQRQKWVKKHITEFLM